MDEEFLKSIGELLAESRRSAGLSQRQLAKLAGVSQPWLCRVEAGQHDVQLSSLGRIADALGLQLEVSLVPKQ